MREYNMKGAFMGFGIYNDENMRRTNFTEINNDEKKFRMRKKMLTAKKFQFFLKVMEKIKKHISRMIKVTWKKLI